MERRYECYNCGNTKKEQEVYLNIAEGTGRKWYRCKTECEREQKEHIIPVEARWFLIGIAVTFAMYVMLHVVMP